MNETLITDLVSQQALDQLEELDRKMEGTLTQFQDCARELARGIKIPVEVTGDLERLRELTNTTMQRAGQAAQQYTQQLQQQQQVIANTTNTISRQLMEQEKLNKSQRAAFTQNQEALRIAEQIVGTYEENNRQLMKYTAELQRNKAELKKVEEMRKNGMITDAEAVRRSGNLMAEQNKLKAAMQEVASVVRIQAKEMNAAEGSYVHLSQQLELLKKAQKGLNDDEKAGKEGKTLEAEIQNLDARLKDLSADMGEFQRNVGNYAIAQGGLKKSYGDLQEVLTGLTIQYREMDDAQRESEEGQGLKEKIDALTEKAGVFRAAMEEVNASVANSAAGQQITRLTFELTAMANEYGRMSDAEKQSARGRELAQKMTDLTQKIAALKGQVDAVAADAAPQSIRKDLKEMTMEIAACTLEYEHMTAAEKESAAGQELKQKIQEMTEKAGELKDVLGDVKESISNSASDTRTWDTLNEAGQVTASVFGLCATAAQAFGVSEESLQASMLKVQQAMQAVQALQVIQNATQKQSNLMKGIAILQSKAAAAAARIEAAATTSATGATKTQTIAQAAFNAVAKANPYVLLATAILAVIGLVVGYTAATKDATKADEEAAKAAEERKNAEENLYSAIGQTAGELMGKYRSLQKQWNALGNDIKAKEQFLKQHQEDFNKIAEAVDGAGAKVNNYNDAEKLIKDRTKTVTDAIMKRARAMAYYAEYIKAVQKEIEILEKMSSPTSYKAGQTISKEEAENLRKHGYNPRWVSADANTNTSGGSAFMPTSAAVRNYQTHGYYTIDDPTAANRASTLSWQAEKDALLKPIQEWQERMWQGFKDNDGDKQANFRSGGGTTAKGSGSSNKSTDNSKSKDEITAAVQDMLLDALKGQDKMLEEFSEKWIEVRKGAIDKEAEVQHAANKKRYDDMVAELEKSKAAGKISNEEYQKQLVYLEGAYKQIELNIDKEAEKEKERIDEEVLKHKQKIADEEVEKIANTAAGKQVIRDKDYQDEVTKLYKEYTEALKVAHQRGEDTAKVTELYNKKKEQLDNQYANETVKATIDALNMELKVAGLSEEERERIRRELTEATTQLAKQEAEQEKKNIEDTVEADKRARDLRNQNLQNWVQKAGEAIQRIGEFMSAMYDNQIAKIEELLEAEQQRYDQEVEHIEYLAERGAITSEEAEIRKREAAAATAKKQEELEKRKAALEYKKAVTEKVNSVSQAAISTALGIMSALAQFPGPVGWALAAAVGAMGAIQIATILAQPIKAYKEGTKGKPHPGGLALVGEGGNQELVMYNGKAWVTPDKPTLLDLPRGAEVFPDATPKDLLSLGASLPMAVPRDRKTGQPVIINDYSALESRVATNTKAVTKTLNQFSDRMAREMKRQKFNAYIASRI